VDLNQAVFSRITSCTVEIGQGAKMTKYAIDSMSIGFNFNDDLEVSRVSICEEGGLRYDDMADMESNADYDKVCHLYTQQTLC
jgi:hypothetical protein